MFVPLKTLMISWYISHKFLIDIFKVDPPGYDKIYLSVVAVLGFPLYIKSNIYFGARGSIFIKTDLYIHKISHTP
jgi:hypothetical protein